MNLMSIYQEIDIENDLEFLADKGEWDESDENENGDEPGEDNQIDFEDNLAKKRAGLVDSKRTKKLAKIVKKKFLDKKINLVFENGEEEEQKVFN